MNIENTLIQFGLKDHEVQVYLASLALGESTVLPISKKAGIKRTYCYDILESLAEKGLVSFVEIRGRRRYSATEPRMVKKIMADRLKQLDEILPDLEAIYQKAPMRPKVRFLQGREAVDIIHGEILKEAKEVWFVGAIGDWAKNFPDYVDYVKKQIDRGIKIRDLVKHGENEPLEYEKLYKKGMQEMRFLPEGMDFETDNMVWNNKLVMISYGADLYAVSIESAEIARTFKEIYKMLWEIGKEVKY